MPFVSVGEVDLFYTDDGAGDPPLLFVHGYSCDSHDWSWQLPHFVDRHRVIAVDNRGHGRSSVPETGYDHLDFAGDLANFLDDLGCGPDRRGVACDPQERRDADRLGREAGGTGLEERELSDVVGEGRRGVLGRTSPVLRPSIHPLGGR